MNKIYLLFLIFIFSTIELHAQQIAPHAQQCIHNFFDGYNTQDFEKMRKLFSPILKLVFSKKNIKIVYGMQYEIMGKANISKITQKSAGAYILELKYDRDTTEIETLGLSISKKGKILGINDPNLALHFPTSSLNKSNSAADSILQYKIDSIANLKHRNANFNGCVLVLKDAKPFYQKSFGYADFQTQSPLDEHTIFDLASLSKQFTAMAIMLLKKQGKLDYAQKIEAFIPDFPYKNISIQNLLNHTSGLPDYMELFDKHWDKTKIAQNQDVLELLKKHKPKLSFKSGTAYEYSNTGYVVLALIIEQLSSKTYAQFIHEHIFQPLEMKDSKVYNTKYSENEAVKNYAKGHAYDAKTQKYVPVTQVSDVDYYRYLDGITGDGAVHSSISDLQKWDNALRVYKLLSKEEFQEAMQPVQLKNEISNYGFGWELQTSDAYQKLIYHSGSWGGNMNFIVHFLDKDLTIIILSNNEYWNIAKFAYKIGDLMNQQ